jgi:hypothetical protein
VLLFFATISFGQAPGDFVTLKVPLIDLDKEGFRASYSPPIFAGAVVCVFR